MGLPYPITATFSYDNLNARKELFSSVMRATGTWDPVSMREGPSSMASKPANMFS